MKLEEKKKPMDPKKKLKYAGLAWVAQRPFGKKKTQTRGPFSPSPRTWDEFFFFQGTNNLSSSPNIFNKQKRLRVACWPSFKRPTGHQKFRQRVYPQKRLDFQLIFFYPKHLKNSLYTLKKLSMASNNPNSDPKTQNQP